MNIKNSGIGNVFKNKKVVAILAWHYIVTITALIFISFLQYCRR